MTYQSRVATEKLLYQTIENHLDEFEERLIQSGKNLPKFIHKEFEEFLKCGDWTQGFVRLYCSNCHHSRFIPFSCKKRGFCPSCSGRRMTQIAMHQIEEIIPEVPIRQWVLTFPHYLRSYLAYKPKAMSDALDVFIQCLRKQYRMNCLPDSLFPPDLYYSESLAIHTQYYPNDIGVCTSIQRCNDALALYPHFHVLSTDGLFTSTTLNPKYEKIQSSISNLYKINPSRQGEINSPVEFIPYSCLSTEEVGEVLKQFRYRLIKRFIKRGYLRPMGDGEDQHFVLYWGDEAPSDEVKHLLDCFSASLQFKKAFGWNAGEQLCFDWDEEPELRIKSNLCVQLDGFGIHAATRIEASDREGVEHLCRYVHRPPLSTDRLKEMKDGRLYYQFKRPWKDGRKGIFFDGADLIERLVALIPTPYKNIVRYHGAFAPRSNLRDWITRGAQFWETVDRIPTFLQQDQDTLPVVNVKKKKPLKKSHRKIKRWRLWAELLKKVFAIDVLSCPHCGLRMQRISFIFDYVAIKSLLPFIHEGEWIGLARGSPLIT